MQLSSVVAVLALHLLTSREVEVLAVILPDGHLRPTQSQLEQVELALLPQQVEQ
jgi:hypothetical protein